MYFPPKPTTIIVMKLSPFTAAACAGLFVASLQAQEKAESVVDSGLKFTAGYAYALETGLEQTRPLPLPASPVSDDVAISAYSAQVDFFTKLEDGSLITLYGAYTQQDFDYSGAGLPIDETTAFSFGTDTFLEVYSGFGVLVTGDMDIPKTNNGTYLMGENYNAGGGVTYSVSDKLKIGAGAVYYGQAQEDSMILPLVYANWQVSDQLSVLLYYPETAGVSFSLDQEKNHVLGLSFNWVKEVYSNNGKSGGLSGNEQVLIDEYYAIQFDYTWQPLTWLSLQPYVAYSMERSWEVWGGSAANSGSKVQEYDIDDTFVLGLNLSLKW